MNEYVKFQELFGVLECLIASPQADFIHITSTFHKNHQKAIDILLEKKWARLIPSTAYKDTQCVVPTAAGKKKYRQWKVLGHL